MFPVLSYATELDYSYFGDEWNLTFLILFNHFHVFDLGASQDVFLIGKDFMSLMGQLHMNFLAYEALQVILSGMVGLKTEDWTVSLSITYNFDDNIGLTLGGILFGGPVDSPGGLFDTNDLVYLKLDYNF